MDFSIKTFDAKSTVNATKTGCVVVGVFENKKLSASASALDSKGDIAAALKSGDITGKIGSSLLLRNVANVSAERVLLVGLGEEAATISEKAFTQAVNAAARALANLGANDATLALPSVKERDTAWVIRTAVLAFHESIFRADGLKSKKDTTSTGVKKVAFGVDAAEATAAKNALAQSIALANGMDLTKELGNLPPNICTPTYLATTAKKSLPITKWA